MFLTRVIVGASVVAIRPDEIKIIDEVNPEKGIHVRKEITPLKTTKTFLRPVLQRQHEVIHGGPSTTSPLRERTKEVIDGKLPDILISYLSLPLTLITSYGP